MANEPRVSTVRLGMLSKADGPRDLSAWEVEHLIYDLDAARKGIAELEAQIVTAKMVGRKGAFEDVCQSLKTFPQGFHDSDVYNGIKELLSTARQLGAAEALEECLQNLSEVEYDNGYRIRAVPQVYVIDEINLIRKEIKCPQEKK